MKSQRYTTIPALQLYPESYYKYNWPVWVITRTHFRVSSCLNPCRGHIWRFRHTRILGCAYLYTCARACASLHNPRTWYCIPPWVRVHADLLRLLPLDLNRRNVLELVLACPSLYPLIPVVGIVRAGSPLYGALLLHRLPSLKKDPCSLGGHFKPAQG